MSFLEYRVKQAPTGLRKVLYLNWPLVVLVTAVAAVGFLMLYSIAGGSLEPWALRQMQVFALGMGLMFGIALVPIWFWRSMAGVAYLIAFLLLLVVEFFGTVGMGAQRWIDLGFIRLQPSEMMKFTLVMMLAAVKEFPSAAQSAGAQPQPLDPAADPLGAGYNIIQAKIALGSGGWSGKGFMQGTQSRLNFLPEKHTDFIFTTLAEEFGFIGAFSLLGLYALILGFCLVAAWQNRDRFSALLIIGVAANFFFYIAVNLSMVMGMAPVVGVPLPLLSYGGSAMMVLLVGFGLVQSAHVHRPR